MWILQVHFCMNATDTKSDRYLPAVRFFLFEIVYTHISALLQRQGAVCLVGASPARPISNSKTYAQKT